MSKVFDEETVEELKKIFESLRKNLKDILIVDSAEKPGASGRCNTCSEAKLLAEELTQISRGKLSFEILNSQEGKVYKPRYLPAFIYDTRKRNIRYYGLPSGQEFVPFIYIHEYISEGIKLPRSVVEEIETIETPLHIKVFVTPECPYCPIVVDFLNQTGLVNENLLIETIEAFENPYEADKYYVQYVPFISINRVEDYDIYGAKPLEAIPGYVSYEEILEAIKRAEKSLKGKRL
ncbi:MAG: thioredoxin family protein [Desulfurococcaceae archaeon]